MSENQKKVWITGASSGIGKAVAEKFAKENWRVAISARRTEILNEIAKNENIFAYPMNVTDTKKTQETFDKILKDFGNIDLCIFSSGTYERKSEKGINVENIKNVMEVNFLGVVSCVKAVEEYFKSKKNGHLAIVSSPVGYRGLPKSSGYTPSKASLNNFTQGIYFDFKKFNIRVTLISPGFIKTALTDKNEFKMPFLKDTSYAAEKIYNGLVNKKSFEIIFPPQIAFIYKIFQILPNKVYNYLISKFVNK
ncbi:MAG: short-chain dehydrogenase [Candidatus Pelagibacter sp.]|nr:short-chain dehydrogenase [Candidatus Pelagibacter sp.]|tara:strand:- start:3896 stop:4648 length:753 start_codon:yes stop_codon:yes gene_type:complete